MTETTLQNEPTSAVVRYSGLRINYAPPEQRQDLWRERLENIQYLLPHLQDALSEPYFADDSIVDLPFDEIVRHGLQNGELFGCLYDGEVVGFVLLRDIRPGRDAWIEAYTTPAFRGKHPCGRQIREILEYAFAPFNPEQTNSQKRAPLGLGLRKIKACISDANTPAAMALKRLGFITFGWSHVDALFKGSLTGTILLEKFNPLLFPQVNPDVRWRQQAQSTRIHSSAPVSERPAVHQFRPGELGVRELRTTGVESEPTTRRRSRKAVSSARKGSRQLQRGDTESLRAVVESAIESDGRLQRGASGEALPPDARDAPISSGRERAPGKRARRK